MSSQAHPIHVITVDNTPAKAKEFLAGLIKVCKYGTSHDGKVLSLQGDRKGLQPRSRGEL